MPLRRHPRVRLISSQTIHTDRVFDLVREQCELPSGLVQDLTIVDHPGAVAVAALDEDGCLLLVRQYRHAVGEWLLELPAGRVEPGEERMTAALRELEEETGYRAARIELLRDFYAAPGFCSERLSLYLARGLSPAGSDARAQDVDEEFELVRRPLASLFSAAHDVVDAKTIIAIASLMQRDDLGL